MLKYLASSHELCLPPFYNTAGTSAHCGATSNNNTRQNFFIYQLLASSCVCSILILLDLRKFQTCPISILKTPIAVKKRTQSPILWLTQFILSCTVSPSSRSTSFNSFHCRKSELDQEDSNERDLITTEDAAISNETAWINQLRLRRTVIELRALMRQYSILEDKRRSSPFDAELHRSQFNPSPKVCGSDS